MADHASGRASYEQYIDYRIFVISAYSTGGFADIVDGKTTLPEADPIELDRATKSQTQLSKLQVGSYTFYKYSIDDFVKNFSIHRSIDGSPATLNLELFPIKVNDTDPDFNFFVKQNPKAPRYDPVFRRMDYIEVQVANLTLKDGKVSSSSLVLPADIANVSGDEQRSTFQNLLNNPDRSSAYNDSTISQNYQVRFRGFITEIEEDDDAESGRIIRLRAKSMLYYLALSPFVTNAALITTKVSESLGAHLSKDNWVVVFGDLLTNLRDTSERVKKLIDISFQIVSDTPTKDPGYYVGSISAGAELELGKVFPWLAVNSVESAAAAFPNTSQAILIPLIETFLAYENNILEDKTLYQIYKANVFNSRIQFGGSNTEFISKYTYLLNTLEEWKESIKYFLYEKASGQIRYERPQFNGTIDNIIDGDKYLQYSRTTTDSGYYSDVFAIPSLAVGEAINFEPFMESSGFSLDELRRFGYRRPDPITNANITQKSPLQSFARTVKTINNSQLEVLSVTMPFDNTIDMANHVWFQEKQLVGYVVELNETIEYGKACSTTMTLTYLRQVTEMLAPIQTITVDNAPRLLTIEDIPQYTFISNFYDGKFT